MQSFRPYTISHVQLTALDEFPIPENNSYLLCWWNKIPLGHLWVEAGMLNSSRQLFKKKIEEIIAPSMQYYWRQQEADDPDWKILLSESRYQELNDLLRKYNKLGQANSFVPEKLSVIVCTRNRPEALTQCLESLRQSADKDFELIVVDNAPDDNATAEVIKKFQFARYVLEEKKGLDIARNTGIRNASHPIIAYTDDDVLVDENWTRNIKTSFSNPITMAVTGPVIAAVLEKESQYIFEKYWSLNKGYVPKIFDHTIFKRFLNAGFLASDVGAGANMAFRREIFDLVGGFDDRLDVGAAGCNGDSELWYRIVAEGWNCEYHPHIFVYHHHRETDKALRKQIFNYMRGHVCSLLVQNEKYYRKENLSRVYFDLPIYYAKKIAGGIRGKSTDKFNHILIQVKGCISGWFFYHVKKKDPGYIFPFSSPGTLPTRIVENSALVSVIIPCYNLAQYLPTAIESILTQTYKNTEIIVVDDGSTDETKAVCQKYEGVKYIRAERVGVSAARNIGIRCSKGNFLVFLDADDFLYPDAISCNLDYFIQDKNVALVSGAHDKLNIHGDLLPNEKAVEKKGDSYLSLLEGNYIAMEATAMYKRELFFAFHFDPKLQFCEDYDLNLYITRYCQAYGHTQKIAAYRIHDRNSSRNKKQMLTAALAVLKRQKKLLRNEQERKAYDSGVNNWKKYYSNHQNPI